MTIKEFDRFKRWIEIGKNPVKGYMKLFPEAKKFFKKLSETKLNGGCFYVDLGHNEKPSKIIGDCVLFYYRHWDNVYNTWHGEWVNVPYNYIQVMNNPEYIYCKRNF